MTIMNWTPIITHTQNMTYTNRSHSSTYEENNYSKQSILERDQPELQIFKYTHCNTQELEYEIDLDNNVFLINSK